jgi:peroxiredoxin
MSNNQENSASAIAEAEKYLQKGQHEKSLKACVRALEADPSNYKAYELRWNILCKIMSGEEARKTIEPEIESILTKHPETPDMLNAVYWGYMYLPGRTKNVPESLFTRMLQYPGTQASLSALDGLAEHSSNPRETWEYKQRIIDEFTIEDVPQPSWYVTAYSEMFRLAEQNRSLASDEYLNELLERYLQDYLVYCRRNQWPFQLAYTQAAEWRIKLSIKLDKALEILELSYARLKEKEEQEWIERYGFGVNIEYAQNEITRLQGQIFLKKEQWKEAYDAIKSTAPPYLTSLGNRFKEDTITYFFQLGRTAEGMGQLDIAIQYYTNAHFAPKPHMEACAGLERVYQTQHGSLEGIDAFLKEAEAEYRKREDQECEVIRQNLIKENINKEAADFTLENLEGKTFTLSAMRGKVILLDIWASWCGPCIRAIPEVEKVYEHFRNVDDVVIWGVNSGETPEKVRAFLEEHHPPWPILLDRNREVRSAYNIEGIPTFALIDKEGHWQYARLGYSEWLGQELIWLVEELQFEQGD